MAARLARVRRDRLPRRRGHGERAVRRRRRRACWCRSSSARPRTSATTRMDGRPRRGASTCRRRELSPRTPGRPAGGLTRDALLAMATKARALAQAAGRAARVRRRDSKALAVARHEARGQAHPLRRHRRRRHERHRRDPAQPRLHGVGLRPGATARRRSACAARASASSIGHDAANIAGADAVVTSTAVQRRQPRGDGRARAARPGGAARGDAGRADAPEAGHRDRRHARQDDHDQPRHQRAGRGRRSTRPS